MFSPFGKHSFIRVAVLMVNKSSSYRNQNKVISAKIFVGIGAGAPGEVI